MSGPELLQYNSPAGSNSAGNELEVSVRSCQVTNVYRLTYLIRKIAMPFQMFPQGTGAIQNDVAGVPRTWAGTQNIQVLFNHPVTSGGGQCSCHV